MRRRIATEAEEALQCIGRRVAGVDVGLNEALRRVVLMLSERVVLLSGLQLGVRRIAVRARGNYPRGDRTDGADRRASS